MDQVRLRELAAVLQAEEKPHHVRFEMSRYINLNPELDAIMYRSVNKRSVMRRLETANVCGTAACIAGHAVIHFEGVGTAIYSEHGDVTYRWSTHARARRLLGLTHEQADALFAPPLILDTIERSDAVAMLSWMAEQSNSLSRDHIIGHWNTLLGNKETKAAP